MHSFFIFAKKCGIFSYFSEAVFFCSTFLTRKKWKIPISFRFAVLWLILLFNKQLVHQYKQGEEKHKNRNAVHAVHKLNIDIIGGVFILFFQVQIAQKLVAKRRRRHKSKIHFFISKFHLYLQSQWGVSSVGRALAWHARGHRFDPVILHKKTKRECKFSLCFFLASAFILALFFSSLF